jgi:hypothetical protein
MAAKRPKSVRARRGSRPAEATAGQVTDVMDLRLLARDAALAALNRLADLSRSEDERIALAATQELLNRAFGKAPAAADETLENRPLIIRIVRFGKPPIDEAQGGEQS